RNMPHCCLPWESGPCLSPNVAGHPLRPATRHCLGAPLPHQLADRPRAPPPALKLSSTVQVDHGTYAVLPGRWAGYSPQAGRLLTCYAPVRRSPPKECPRLACVKHAASVRPEPGSNSPREMKKARQNTRAKRIATLRSCVRESRVYPLTAAHEHGGSTRTSSHRF